MFWRSPSSLRARLALWYLLILGLVLALFGAGIYLEVRPSLLAAVDTALQARADAVVSQTSIGADGVQFEGGDAPRAAAEMAAYIFDAHGRLQQVAERKPDHAVHNGVGSAGERVAHRVGGLGQHGLRAHGEEFEQLRVVAGSQDRLSPAVFYYVKSFGAFAEYMRSTQRIWLSKASPTAPPMRCRWA